VNITLIDVIRSIAFFVSLCAILCLEFYFFPKLGFGSVWLAMGLMVLVLALTAMAATHIESTVLILLSIIVFWATATACDLLSSQVQPVASLQGFLIFACSHCAVFLLLRFVVLPR
jgi:hypothetical protein